MINFNTLLIEAHRLPLEMKKDSAVFVSFLDTMAKYHRYNLTSQMNLHYHAPAGARAVALPHVWNSIYNTTLVEGATPIPVLIPNENAKNKYDLMAVYDVADTVGFQLGDETLTNEPWAYNEERNAESSKAALGEPSAETVESAVHIAVQKQVAASDSDYPSMLAAAVEYVVRSRMGLPKNTEVISSISLDGINMDNFLEDAHNIAKNLLDSVGRAVRLDLKKAAQEEVEITQEEIPLPEIHANEEVVRDEGFALDDNLTPAEAEERIRVRFRELQENVSADPEKTRDEFHNLIDAISFYGKLPQDVSSRYFSEIYLELARCFKPVIADEKPAVRPELPHDEDAEVINIGYSIDTRLTDWFSQEFPDFDNSSVGEQSFAEILAGLQDGSLDLNAIGLDNDTTRGAFLDELSNLSGVDRAELFMAYTNNSLVHTPEEEREVEIASGVETPVPGQIQGVIDNINDYNLWLGTLRRMETNAIDELIDSNISVNDLVVLGQIHETHEELAIYVEDLLNKWNFASHADFLIDHNYSGYREYVENHPEKDAVPEVPVETSENAPEATEEVPATTEKPPLAKLPEDFAQQLVRHNLPTHSVKILDNGKFYRGIKEYENTPYANYPESEMATITLNLPPKYKLEADLHFSYEPGKGYHISSNVNVKFGDWRGMGSYPFFTPNATTYETFDEAFNALCENLIKYEPTFKDALESMGLIQAESEVMDNLFEQNPSQEAETVQEEAATAESEASEEENVTVVEVGSRVRDAITEINNAYPEAVVVDERDNAFSINIPASSDGELKGILQVSLSDNNKYTGHLDVYVGTNGITVNDIIRNVGSKEYVSIHELMEEKIKAVLEDAQRHQNDPSHVNNTELAEIAKINFGSILEKVQERVLSGLSTEVLATYPALELTASTNNRLTFKIPSNTDSACDVMVSITRDNETGKFTGSSHFAFADYNSSIPMVSTPENIGPFDSIHEALNANLRHLQGILDGSIEVAWAEPNAGVEELNALRGIDFSAFSLETSAPVTQQENDSLASPTDTETGNTNEDNAPAQEENVQEDSSLAKLPADFAQQLARYNLEVTGYETLSHNWDNNPDVEMANVSFAISNINFTLHFSYEQGKGYRATADYNSYTRVNFEDKAGEYPYFSDLVGIPAYETFDEAIQAISAQLIENIPEIEGDLTNMGLYKAPAADMEAENSLQSARVQAWTDVFAKLETSELVSLSDSSAYTAEMVENWGIEPSMMDKLVTSVRTTDDLTAIGYAYQQNESLRPKIEEMLSHWNYGDYAQMLHNADFDNYFDAVKNPVQGINNVQTEESVMVREYKYYMNQRPISPGTTPRDFSRFDEEDKGGRYGAVYFDRPLTEQEIADFELTPAETLTENTERASDNAPQQVQPEPSADTSSDSTTDDNADATEEAEEAEEESDYIEYEDISLRPVDDSFTGIDLESLDFDADMTSAAGKRAVFMRNLAALQIVNHLDETKTRPNELELKVLKAYSGFGGIPEAFDAHNSAWKNLYELAKEEMTDAQYTAARASTLTAFYTPHEIIESIYKGLENYGFKGGNILDPSTGNGRFLDDMPEEMKENSNRVGIEIDLITAQVAKYANPSATIINNGFEKTNYPNGSFDLAISNIPFQNVVIHDNRYEDSSSMIIHDYFIRRMLDEVRPGGVVAVITSKGTMDRKSSGFRQEIARKAELVQAVRFPNSVFKGAGTEAVSDLLIFRKRERELSPTDELPSWVESKLVNDATYTDRGRKIDREYWINQYFLDNPENIMGARKTKSTAYGYDLDVVPLERNVNGQETEEIPITELLDSALSRLPQNGYTPSETPLPAPREERSLQRNVAYGYYFDKKDIVYLAPSGEKRKVKLSGTARKKVVAAMAIRDEIRSMFDAETHNCDDETLANHQAKLNDLYDKYVKDFGPINNDKTLKQSFQEDSAYPLLLSLEVMEDDEVKAKSNIFSQRTIQAYQAPTHADTAEEALMISVAEKGTVDIPYMSSLTGLSNDELVDKLEFVSIFEDYETNRFMTADEYLSGDVRNRLEVTENEYKRIEEEITNYAENELYPLPNRYIYNENNYPNKFSVENMKTYSFVRSLTESDIEYLFDSKNRALLAMVFQQVSRYRMEDTINFYKKNHPEFESQLSQPDFFLNMLPSLSTPSDIINYPYEGSKTLYRIFKFADIPVYRPLTRVDYAFVKKVLGEYAHGEYPEVLDSDNLKKMYRDFTAEYEQNIDNFIHNNNDPLIQSYRNDMERLEKNINALRGVIPKDLTADEINIHLGAGWIPTYDIQDFIEETFSVHGNCNVQYSEHTGLWKIGNTKFNNTKVDEIFGVENEANALVLLEKCLNHRAFEIKKTVIIDGEEKRVTDRKKTLLVAQKMENIRKEFSDWIFKNPDRANRLVEYYNRHFNNIVPREFDGSYLKFPGMNPEITLLKHQKDAVARSLFGGNSLFAHVVGAGKTFEMQASAMEAKRIGLCKKPLFIMPKHLTEQFGAEFIRLYPNAKILVSTPKDSGKENRRNFCAKISAQDWDAVVMSYEQFEKIPLSLEQQKHFIQKEVDEAMEGYEELKRMEGEGFTVKQAEKKIRELKDKLESITKEYSKHQDETITFEQLGIDRLYVDEAHNYKNLGFFTKMTGVASANVQKTDDLYAKVSYLNELTNERGVVFASGTPISNSFAEFYTMQKYLKPSRLESQGIKFFDLWASTFGQEVTQLELSADGQSYNTKTRFAKFDNLPELVSMFREYADVKTADMLNLEVPDCELVVEKSAPSPLQKEMVSTLVKRGELIKTGRPTVVNPEANMIDKDKGLDNMLVVINDGRNVALDPRIIDQENPDFEDSKVNRCIKNVMETYKSSEEIKGTQLVFCDLSTPKKGKDAEGVFTIYDDIVKKLIEQGIPKEEIAVIHDYEKPEQKQKLFNKVNKGEVRVLLGSSDKLGIGTNVQKRLVATHDLDCPWKPSQIEQRRGRIVRKGNMNKKVKIFRYITEGTFDAFMWQTNERKQGFISQIMTSKSPSRSITDMDSTQMEFAELKAACTNNPLFKEQMELSQQVDALTVERVQYQEIQKRLKPKVENELPSNINMYKARIEATRRDLHVLEEHQNDDKFYLNGQELKLEEAGKAFAAVCAAYREGKIDFKKSVYGEYRGIKIEVHPNISENMRTTYDVTFRGDTIINVPVGMTTIVENQNRFNMLNEYYTNKLTSNQSLLKNTERELETCKEEYGKPFAKEEEYQQKTSRLAEVNVLVSADKELEELNLEKEKRVNQINDPSIYEGGKEHHELYLSAASDVMKANNGEWPDNGDEIVADKLRNSGVSAKDIVDAIIHLSPECPNIDDVKEKFNKKDIAACR